MSVFRKRENDGTLRPTFSYEFELGGRRFNGNTGETSERKAQAHERIVKEEARKQLILNGGRHTGAPWTFGKAMAVYINEQLKGEIDPSTKTVFTWLQRHIPNDTPLPSFNTPFIAGLIAKRASEPGKKPGMRVTDSTINRTVTEPIRRILRYASEIHEQQIRKINWKGLMRDEPQVRVRELMDDEEKRLFDNLREDYHPIVRFCIVSGLRLFEACNLTWQDVDFGNSRVWITGKGNKRAPIPLSPTMRSILMPLRGHHDESVFTYVAKRTTTNPNTGKRYNKGERYPISYEGLKTTFSRNRSTAKLIDFRFHDLRHTAATRILRGSKNLKAVQVVLRHEDIATTMRYAHVLDEDVLEAMEQGVSHRNARSPTESPTETSTSGEKTMKSTS